MKRKVIQIANSTQLISLPRKWTQKYGVKKGDEIEVEEKGNKLLIGTEKGIELNKIEIDMTGLDRTSILYCIRSFYRNGYDEVILKFQEPYTLHLRKNEKVKVIAVIHEVVSKLTGFEIIEQKENSCVIKDISETSQKDFDVALRRVFLLLLDVNKDLLDGTKNDDRVLVETIEDKHNSVLKFVSYCLRILNKKGYADPRRLPSIYHIISNLDKVVDVIKYNARYYVEHNIRLSKESKGILENMHQTINDFYDFFYKFDLKKLHEMYENRDKTLKAIVRNAKKMPYGDLYYLSTFASIHELISDIADHRISLEY